MAAEKQTLIVVPVDGSENSLKSLDYTNLMFGPKHNLKVTVLHVLPGLPPVLIEESRKDAKMGEQSSNLKKKNIGLAERLLVEAKNKLVLRGFAESAVETVYQERRVGIARDICNWAEDNRADALIINTARDILDEARSNGIGTVVLGKRGYSNVKDFSMGSIARKVLDGASDMAVCIVP
jgi:nucleotide-binding universal stress UspA family protein